MEKCYSMWEDRTLIPQWMPWIRTVEVRSFEQASLYGTAQTLCSYAHVVDILDRTLSYQRCVLCDTRRAASVSIPLFFAVGQLQVYERWF